MRRTFAGIGVADSQLVRILLGLQLGGVSDSFMAWPGFVTVLNGMTALTTCATRLSTRSSHNSPENAFPNTTALSASTCLPSQPRVTLVLHSLCKQRTGTAVGA